jgi:hypothetical protein
MCRRSASVYTSRTTVPKGIATPSPDGKLPRCARSWLSGHPMNSTASQSTAGEVQLPRRHHDRLADSLPLLEHLGGLDRGQLLRLVVFALRGLPIVDRHIDRVDVERLGAPPSPRPSTRRR